MSALTDLEDRVKASQVQLQAIAQSVEQALASHNEMLTGISAEVARVPTVDEALTALKDAIKANPSG